MALMLLDENAAKNQRKAIFAFLTAKVPTTDKLFQNPFNWRGNTTHVLDTSDVIDFCSDIMQCRDMFEMIVVEEVLEIPC
jgi:uncharacterized protein YfdQ (DUF2303 family)